MVEKFDGRNIITEKDGGTKMPKVRKIFSAAPSEPRNYLFGD